MSKIVIFGGSGSFGTRMTQYILDNSDWDIIIVSRSEKMQFEHKQKVDSNRVQYIIGDIRDYNTCYNVLNNVDYVICAAAMKYIDKCEANPFECTQTNVNGVINVINASIERNVKKLLFTSTDKAVNPTTIYGCAKLYCEMYAKAVNNKNTSIIRTRYGNVFGSNGSVAWVFDHCVKENKPLTVTNPEMTRFFMDIDEAIELVWKALTEGTHGDLWCYNNKSATIKQLADCFSNNQVVNGLRCIEKNDEALISLSELNHSVLIDNKYFRINDSIISNVKYDKSLTSENADRLTTEEIKNLIIRWRNRNKIN